MRFLIFALCCATGTVIGQTTDISLLQNLKPRAIGPASMSGRVTSIAVFHSDANLMYVGTASGGLWKSTTGGIHWEPVFDKMDVGSIGAVAIQQNNAAVIWAGTGEGNPRNSHNSGKGIYKSMDGGKTWKLMGLENTKTIHRIIIDPQNPENIYVAAMGSIWGANAERGVFKSSDGGKTWQKILYNNEFTGCAELTMDPQHPNKLFAAMYDYQRKPYTFRSGGKGSGLYMTIDGGVNWTKLGETNQLPGGTLGRIGVAVAASNPDKVYAIIESTKLELYSSEDGGYQWKKVSDAESIGNRPFYYNEIYVDPKNENHLISLWSQVTESIDGGKNWSTMLDWGHIHPDHHAFYIHPDNPDLMMDGNDGGLNISNDGGKNWRYISNLPVGQFYHVSVDDEIPYNVYGGLQDNGSWKGPGFTFRDGGIRNADWKEVLFGDGFDVVPIRGNAQQGYAAWQGGNVYFYDLQSGKNQAIQPVHPDGKYLRFNWNAAIAAHPTHKNALYYGSQFVHKSYNNGMSWTIISPDLTTNDTAKLHQEKSGGLTIDATNAENYCTIIAIVPAVSDTNVIWVGTDDGNVQLTRDGGKNWTLLTPKILGAPKNAWVPFIHVSKTNPGEAWVVMNNYRQNDWQPYLFKTTDFGNTWKRMADASKVSGHCLSVLPDPVQPRLVWLGTDHGLWISFNGGESWKKWTYGFPGCPVQDMVLQERENDLVIGTFGRSIYIFDDIRPFRMAASEMQPKKALKIYSTSHAYLADHSRPSGERFGADAFFEGANKPRGSQITVYATAQKNKDQHWQKGTLTVYILKDNKRIRTYETNYDSTSLFRFGWNLTSDGYRFPAHYNKPDADSVLPSGLNVGPGMYTIIVKNGIHSDTAKIEVSADPNNPIRSDAEARRQALYERLRTSVDRAYKAFEALKNTEETIKSITNTSYENDSAKSNFTRLSAPLKDSIAVLKLLFMHAQETRYYEEVIPRLNDYLSTAYRFIISDQIPSQNAENALRNAERQTEAVMKRINTFYDKQWTPFRLQVEKEKIKIFKEMGGY